MRLLFIVFALLVILVFSATMDVLDGSAQLNIVWSEKKKLMAQGHDPVRADQLLFRLLEAPMSKFGPRRPLVRYCHMDGGRRV